MLGDGTSEPSFILWGDSHAQALAPAFDAVAKQYDVTGYLANHSACPPLLDVYREGDTTCLDFNNAILKDIEAHPEWNTVILSGRWALSADGQRYKTEEGESVVLVDVQSSAPTGSNALIFENGMDRTIQKLLDLNRKVIIVSTVPEVGYDVPSAYFIALRTGRDINKIIAPTTNEYNERNAIVTDVLNKMKSRYNIQVIHPAQILCDKNICNVVLEGQPLYKDFAPHFQIWRIVYRKHLRSNIRSVNRFESLKTIQEEG
ncbi:MAG: SGNH hydrolase domain-containing protein [Anaerolineales bacterium]